MLYTPPCCLISICKTKLFWRAKTVLLSNHLTTDGNYYSLAQLSYRSIPPRKEPSILFYISSRIRMLFSISTVPEINTVVGRWIYRCKYYSYWRLKESKQQLFPTLVSNITSMHILVRTSCQQIYFVWKLRRPLGFQNAKRIVYVFSCLCKAKRKHCKIVSVLHTMIKQTNDF